MLLPPCAVTQLHKFAFLFLQDVAHVILARLKLAFTSIYPWRKIQYLFPAINYIYCCNIV